MATDYVFACARIRSNEKYLLNSEKLNQMIEARTPEDACKILQDAHYGDEGDVIDATSYESALLKESDKLYALLHSLAPDAFEFNIFAYPFDYHNIKVLIKAEALGSDGTNLLMNGGSIDPIAMSVIVKERTLQSLTSHMRKALEESLDTLARTKDPQCVDLICDRECYRDILETAEKSKNKFILGYVNLLIDTINLKTFARCKRMDKDWNYFSLVYLQGGNISEKTFVSGYDEPLQQFATRITGSALSIAAEEGGVSFKDTGSFTSIEKLCDDALISYVKDAKYISFGIEPLIGYAVAKQMEIKSVRIILSGKLGGLSPELIEERVRETYG